MSVTIEHSSCQASISTSAYFPPHLVKDGIWVELGFESRHLHPHLRPDGLCEDSVILCCLVCDFLFGSRFVVSPMPYRRESYLFSIFRVTAYVDALQLSDNLCLILVLGRQHKRPRALDLHKTSQHAGDLLTKSLLVRGLSGMLLRCKYDVFPHSSMLPRHHLVEL